MPGTELPQVGQRVGRLRGLGDADRRAVWTAFFTLLTIVAAHAVLETARDTLFLRDLPVGYLPWAYLGIASLSLATARWSTRLPRLHSPSRVLAATLLAGASGTALFWPVVKAPTATSLVSLYIWTGVLVSVVVTHFWVALSNRMDVGRARQAYPLVAAGGMVGATLGSLLAGAALTVTGPRSLLPLAAGLFALAAVLVAVAGDAAAKAETAGGDAGADPAAAAPGTPAPAAAEKAPGLRKIWADPYLRRILQLAAAAPVVAMGIDFIFKSLVVQQVAAGDLGPFFARYNFVINGAALLFQFALAPRILRNVGVVGSLCLLPGALAVAAVGVVATGALPAALVLRGTDGILRHSLQRTATEILFLPLTAATRGALRALAESLGQRGGQMAGSLLILAAIAAGAAPEGLAGGVAALGVLWLFATLRLQRHYVARFRSQLRTLTATGSPAVPDLDLQSLELLVGALGSSNDAEVLAALDMLAGFGRTRLVTPLILFHPSTAVVKKALELFEDPWRDDVQEMRRRLLDHDDAEVRAAALRSLVAGGYDRSIVRTVLRSDRSPLVRYTALTLWTGFQDSGAAGLDEAIADLVSSPDADSRLAIASTMSELPPRVMLPVAQALLADATPQIRRLVAKALGAGPDVERISLLLELLAFPECREAARAGLVTLGTPAIEQLAAALAAAQTPASIRRHLPRTISRFRSARAALALLEQLGRESDGRVSYKLLRGLGHLSAKDPTLPVDSAVLVAEAESNLQRAQQLLAYRVGHDLLRERSGGNARYHELLADLLEEKEERALEKVFRVLQVLETSEEYATIYAALSSEDPLVRAGARELLDNVLEGRFGDGLLALTDSLPPPDRLRGTIRALPLPLAETVIAAAAWTRAADDDVDPALVILDALASDRSAALAALARRLRASPEPEQQRAAV